MTRCHCTVQPVPAFIYTASDSNPDGTLPIMSNIYCFPGFFITSTNHITATSHDGEHG